MSKGWLVDWFIIPEKDGCFIIPKEQGTTLPLYIPFTTEHKSAMWGARLASIVTSFL
jgi:hypothetical protein